MAENQYTDPLEYDRALNEWHCELSCVVALVDHVFQEMEGPDWMTSAGFVCRGRLSYLVESLPFLNRQGLPLQAPSGAPSSIDRF